MGQNPEQKSQTEEGMPFALRFAERIHDSAVLKLGCATTVYTTVDATGNKGADYHNDED